MIPAQEVIQHGSKELGRKLVKLFLKNTSFYYANSNTKTVVVDNFQKSEGEATHLEVETEWNKDK